MIEDDGSPTKPVAVIAFGGNALLRPTDHGTQEQQFTLTWKASRWLYEIIHRGYELAIVHGNGPQVGNIMIQVEEAITKIPPQSLDVAVAQTQGSMGFMLANQLRNRFNEEQIEKDIAAVLTEVVVDRDDPAFDNPTKPVGPFFTSYRANLLMQEQGWQMVEEIGRGWRKFASGSSGGVVEHDPNTGHVLGTLTTDTFYALSGGGDEWLSENPSSGTIVPGGSANVSLNVRSGRLLGGTYRAVVRVRNNDPSRPVADASVQMRVIGAPNIVTSRDTLRYVGTFVGYADTLDLGIGNTGTDTVRVNAMSISSPFFSVIGATTFRVPPSKIRTVRVSFAPTSPGTIVGSLAILSNDPTDSLKTVNLVGSAVHPPAIATSADSLAFTCEMQCIW